MRDLRIDQQFFRGVGAIGMALLFLACSPQKPFSVITEELSSQSSGGVQMRTRSNNVYSNMLSDLLGQSIDRALLANWTPSLAANGFESLAWASPDSKMISDRMALAEKISAQALLSPRVMTCQPKSFSQASWKDCAQQVVVTFAERAFRRPLTAIELTQFRVLFETQAASAQTVIQQNGSEIGFLDYVGPDLKLYGWSVDQGWPERPVEVHFYVNGPAGTGQFAGATLANQPRPDVNQIIQVPGDHGFVFQLPSSMVGKVALVYAYAIGGSTNPSLSTSPHGIDPLQTVNLANLKAGMPPIAFSEGVRAVIEAVLMSPDFLFDMPSLSDSLGIEDFRNADRLALFFSGSIPDDQLWQAAAAGRLHAPDDIKAHASRLLVRYIDRLVNEFGGQWLGFRALAAKNDKTPLEDALVTESRMVLKELILSNRPISAILNPGFTYANTLLADHYGLPAVDPSAGFQRVQTQSRGGILDQGSWLHFATTFSELTTPIRRGRWVVENLLCRTIPLPDPSLNSMIQDSLMQVQSAELDIEKQLENHRNHGPVCMSCHQYMDEVGISLTEYDFWGKKRSSFPNGKAVPTSGTLDNESVRSAKELATKLVSKPQFSNCITRKFLLYAGVSEAQNQETQTNELLQQLAPGADIGLKDLILKIVTSPEFLGANEGRQTYE